MDEFQEFNIAVRVRVLRTDSDSSPERQMAESAAMQAVANALLMAEGNGFEHDHSSELSVVFKDADVLPSSEGSLA